MVVIVDHSLARGRVCSRSAFSASHNQRDIAGVAAFVQPQSRPELRPEGSQH